MAAAVLQGGEEKQTTRHHSVQHFTLTSDSLLYRLYLKIGVFTVSLTAR